MNLNELSIGDEVVYRFDNGDSITAKIIRTGRIKVQIGVPEGGKTWVYPARIERVLAACPPGCDRGTMINQNLPTALCNIGYRVDPLLPPGTIEFWQDGKRVGRIENIGLK